MTEKKRIIFVINYFYPDLAATSQLLTELTERLQDDFDITVVAAQPGYAGEVAESKKRFEVGYLDTIKIIRLKLPAVDKSSKASRLRYILSYFLLANMSVLKEKKADVIFTISQPPVLGGLIGSIGKLLKRSRHIYSIHDFNPEQAEAVAYTGNPLIFKIARAVDTMNCRYSDQVLLVGRDMVDTLEKRFKGEKLPPYTVISNWTDERDILPLDKEEENVQKFLIENKLEDKFIIMYSGNLGLYYDLQNIIKIAENFKGNPDIVFLFIGEGAVKKEMQEYAHLRGLKNTVFLPYQPKEFIRYSLNAADIHLVVNQKGIKGVSVPSKIYGVMAAGKPVLGVVEQDSEIDRLVSESGCGKIVEPQDYEGIAETVSLFHEMNKTDLKEMGLNGRRYLDKHLTNDISINKYREVLKEVSGSEKAEQKPDLTLVRKN